jgi:hypothetical protein
MVWPAGEFRGTHTSGSGKLSVGLWFVARRYARLVVLGEDLTDEFSAAGHMAVAGVDGVTFRLHHSRLVLARTCDYCGTGLFESPTISSCSDLGYALADWRPPPEDCEGYSEDPPDF